MEESGRGSEESNDTESGGSVGESGEGRKMPVNSVMVGEEGGREVVVVRVKLPEVASADQINLDGSEVREREREKEREGTPHAIPLSPD